MSTPRPEDFDRVPPHDLDAEQALLGSLCADLRMAHDVSQHVRHGDFYDQAHAILFKHLVAVASEWKKFDVVLFRQRLDAAGELQASGGVELLHKCLRGGVVDLFNAQRYAEIIANHALRRFAIEAMIEGLKHAYSEDNGVEVVRRHESRVSALLERQVRLPCRAAESYLDELFHELDARRDGRSVGLPTGLRALDFLTNGFRAGQMIVVGGVTGIGKSALMMAMAANATDERITNRRTSVLYVTLEMPSVEVLERMLSSAARVDGGTMRRGNVSREDRERLLDEAGRMRASKSKLHFHESRDVTVSDIALIARGIQRRESLGMIVIDYLQLLALEPQDARRPRHEQVANLSRSLKRLAGDLGVPIVVGAQLNKQTEQGSDKRPKLSHLRESAAIGHDADVVILLHRESYFKANQAPEIDEAELIVAKQRSGPTGTGKVEWRPKWTRLADKPDDGFSEPLFGNAYVEPADLAPTQGELYR